MRYAAIHRVLRDVTTCLVNLRSVSIMIGRTKIVNMNNKPKIVVSLTTMPNRVQYLHNTLNSLANQSLKVDSIQLNIPLKYRRSDLGEVNVSDIPQGFNVYRCTDYGPATKLIPTLKRYQKDDVIIIYCDDDRIYHEKWVERLVNTHTRNPGCCVFEEGADIPYHFRIIYKNFFYRLKRIASFGLWKPFKKNLQNTHLVEGYGGVLITPKMFDERVFKVPDEFIFVDDMWFSANLTRNKIPLVRSRKSRLQRSRKVIVDGVDLGGMRGSLKTAVLDNMKRHELDVIAINTAIETMGIWPEYQTILSDALKAYRRSDIA